MSNRSVTHSSSHCTAQIYDTYLFTVTGFPPEGRYLLIYTCYKHEKQNTASNTNYVTNTYVTVTLKPAIGWIPAERKKKKKSDKLSELTCNCGKHTWRQQHCASAEFPHFWMIGAHRPHFLPDWITVQCFARIFPVEANFNSPVFCTY